MIELPRRALLAGALVTLATGARADDYPVRRVRIIVPFASGGIADLIGRLLAQKLSENFGQSFYIENRAGGGSNVGTAVVASAAADGYTLLLTTSSYVVNPSLMAAIPYNPDKDFAAVTIVARSPNLLVIDPALPVKTVAELIEYVRKTPGVSFASAGVGTTPHLSGELFRLALNLDMVHVPFGGAGPALQSTAGGHTPIAFTALPPAVSLVTGGQLRALAVTSATRSSALPDVPTMAEAGLAGQEAETIVPLLVPAATPRAVVDQLYAGIAKAMAASDVGQTLATLGFTPYVANPEDSSVRLKDEIARWAKVIRDAKITRQ